MDGKGAADIHFATAMRFVDRYIEERRLDVVTPKYLVDAINYGEGMEGCIGELFDIDHKCSQELVWAREMKLKESEGGFCTLGRVNEARYAAKKATESFFLMETFTYKYSTPVVWKLEIGKSTILKGGREIESNIEESVDCTDNTGILSADVLEDDDEIPIVQQSTGTELLFCG